MIQVDPLGLFKEQKCISLSAVFEISKDFGS